MQLTILAAALQSIKDEIDNLAKVTASTATSHFSAIATPSTTAPSSSSTPSAVSTSLPASILGTSHLNIGHGSSFPSSISSSLSAPISFTISLVGLEEVMKNQGVTIGHEEIKNIDFDKIENLPQADFENYFTSHQSDLLQLAGIHINSTDTFRTDDYDMIARVLQQIGAINKRYGFFVEEIGILNRFPNAVLDSDTYVDEMEGKLTEQQTSQKVFDFTRIQPSDNIFKFAEIWDDIQARIETLLHNLVHFYMQEEQLSSMRDIVRVYDNILELMTNVKDGRNRVIEDDKKHELKYFPSNAKHIRELAKTDKSKVKQEFYGVWLISQHQCQNMKPMPKCLIHHLPV